MQTVKKEYKQKRKEADGKRERGGDKVLHRFARYDKFSDISILVIYSVRIKCLCVFSHKFRNSENLAKGRHEKQHPQRARVFPPGKQRAEPSNK